MENQKIFNILTEKVLQSGAARAAVIDTNQLVMDASFRDICAANACGMYGKCWMCPPDIGDIHMLMDEIHTYDFVLVYQTVSPLEDSFDIEGMYEAGNIHNQLAQHVRGVFVSAGIENALHLGVGGCRICQACAKVEGEPCRFSDKAMSSLEAYGINVSQMAAAAGMKYTNGINTVTYFGAAFFHLPPHTEAVNSDTDSITVTVDGVSRKVSQGTKLSAILGSEIPCGGHGKCGKCKVLAKGNLSVPTETERTLLGEEALSNGIRLACSTMVEGECTIQTTLASETKQSSTIVASGEMPVFEIDPIFKQYGVAVDIGTTTLAAVLYDSRGMRIAQKSRLNPQSVFGADVISRMEASMNGETQHLQRLIIGALDELLTELAGEVKISTQDIDGIVITGNTVMLHLLAGESVKPLAAAPFAAERLFDETVTAAELGVSAVKAVTPVYLPPCISAFVGADTVCAILTTGIYKKSKGAMLVDIGTNGEIALCLNGRLIVCSTAAGPAFEGVGISRGMRGETGAVDKVWMEGERLKAHTIHETNPVGICGSGLVDAVACLLKRGDLDETGYLEEDVPITGNVTITAKDIRMVQLAKGAIHAGINTVIHSSKLSPADISTLFIAGGFGNYLNIENAGEIGLIPRSLAGKVRVTGNSALSGAIMLLLRKDFCTECVSFAHSAEVLELSSNPVFTNEFMEQMMF